MKLQTVVRYEGKVRTTVRLFATKAEAQAYADEMNEVAYRAIYVVRAI